MFVMNHTMTCDVNFDLDNKLQVLLNTNVGGSRTNIYVVILGKFIIPVSNFLNSLNPNELTPKQSDELSRSFAKCLFDKIVYTF